MIECKDIRKSYGSLEVLRGVSLNVAKGEVVSIVGASGAGKTTLLQVMGTLSRQDSGTVRINGVDVSAMRDRELSDFRNSQIGFVFQFHHLLPEFTAFENICIPALIGHRAHIFAVNKDGIACGIQGGHRENQTKGRRHGKKGGRSGVSPAGQRLVAAQSHPAGLNAGFLQPDPGGLPHLLAALQELAAPALHAEGAGLQKLTAGNTGKTGTEIHECQTPRIRKSNKRE